MDDPRVLTTPELDAIAHRTAREPTYQVYADCSQAFADRRALLGHIVALQATGERALAAIAGADVIDLHAARQLVRDRQDRSAEWPDAIGWVHDEDRSVAD